VPAAAPYAVSFAALAWTVPDGPARGHDWRPLLAVVSLLGMMLSAGPAGAHAVPVTMDPEPNARLDEAPREVVIRFSERIEGRPSTLEVLDARGQRVDQGEAAVDPADPWRYRVRVPALPTGAYTVSWRVLSADDGHVTHGAHVFTVGAATAARAESGPTVRSGAGWRPVARWMVALGGALLLGAVVAAPLLGVGAAGRSVGTEILAGMAVAIGGTLDVVLQARQLAGPRPVLGVLTTLLGAPPGRVWLIRAGLLLALTAVWALDARGARGGAGRWWLRLALSAALVMTGGLVSHVAATSDGWWLLLGVQAVHLLAVASWIGGLLGFATVFWRAGVGSVCAREAVRLASAIPAFSGLAVLAVGSLALSGLILARLHLAAWAELLGTAYGRWLAAKVVVFLAMLGLGAWHQGWVEPLLLRAIQRGEAASRSVPRFRRSIRVEAALGLVALALAGVLGVTAPPAPSPTSTDRPASAPFRHERALDEARVRLEIAPLRPGPNTIRLTVTDPSGRPLGDATAAMVQVTPVDASVGAVTFQLDHAAPGEFVAPAAVLGLVGRWNGRVVVQRSGAYDVNDRFELVVSDDSATHAHGEPSGPVRRPWPFDRVTGWAALVTITIALPLFLRSRRRLQAAHLLADTQKPPAVVPAPR
jgi:copper transport protein